MKSIDEISDKMVELLEAVKYEKETGELIITEDTRKMIDEISDFSEQTDIFKSNRKNGQEVLSDGTASQAWGYMLNRIVNAPTTIHRDASVILIMPFIREKLIKEQEAKK